MSPDLTRTATSFHWNRLTEAMSPCDHQTKELAE